MTPAPRPVLRLAIGLGAAAAMAMIAVAPALAAKLDAQTINTANFAAGHGKASGKSGGKAIDPVSLKAQVLLARAHFSPGEIDGRDGENLHKAIKAFAAANGLSSDGAMTAEIWDRLTSASKDPVVTTYRITDDDVAGPFVAKIPGRMEEMKDLPRLGYTTPLEEMSEKLHMSPELLKALNPGKALDRPCEEITAVNIPDEELPKVASILVDKTAQTVVGRDESGQEVAFFPATVGSTEKPAPSGKYKIIEVEKNPNYRYNPEYHFKGVKATKPFTIKPGPNNPVGLVWIGLNAKGYGIHGTPDPGRISKSESHGCVRLTNWDALALAEAVHKGVAVEFTGDEAKARAGRHRR